MFEYHGWATIQDSQRAFTEAADSLTYTAYDAVARELPAITNDLQTTDLRVVNASCHLWLAGLRNHRQDEVVAVFGRIAVAAPWSYGLLHTLDDEAAGADENRWAVWVMRRGTVTREADAFLSPHVGVAEDA